eukprot:COSAG01_NODE_3770_length_5716_cov_2.466619_5_plen_70_part_00
MTRRTTRTTKSFLRRSPAEFSLSATPNVANHHTYTFNHYKTHSFAAGPAAYRTVHTPYEDQQKMVEQSA